MRTSILAVILAFGATISVPALAQPSTGSSSQPQVQDEADKGIKTRNSGESGYVGGVSVGEQERKPVTDPATGQGGKPR